MRNKSTPYEWQGTRHEYRPDYLVRWRAENGSEIKVILEVKVFETGKDQQKEDAARRWVRAVNHHGGFGRWVYVICRKPNALERAISEELHRITRA